MTDSFPLLVFSFLLVPFNPGPYEFSGLLRFFEFSFFPKLRKCFFVFISQSGRHL